MHTPAGFTMIDGQAHVTSWLEIVFNPSMPYRLTHMLLASGLTVAFLIAGISAYRWLRGDRGGDVRAGIKTGIVLAAVLIPVQILVGDLHGLNTLKHQPAKIAAMEGIWETERGAPLLLFALPDEQARENRLELGIPYAASLILKHDPQGELLGLNEFEGEHPPVAPVFWSFRIMVGSAMLMLAVAWIGAWQLWRRGSVSPLLARALVSMTFIGWIATVAGWYVTEIGRQPWLVQGVLTTAEAVGPVPAGMVASTLAMYLSLYALLLTVYLGLIFHLARKGTPAAPQPLPGLVPASA
jgi:cytochrome bd ubiquinol oxidase subunit I